ncbi:MAG TPA: ABC transporter permease [Longimicrobium sp.]|jgi:predicted permease
MPRPPGFALVRAVRSLVPRHLRDAWLAEWEGELAYAWRRAERSSQNLSAARARLHWRALGASSDALWLWRRHGATGMIGFDLRYAARSLRRRPGFVAVVVLTLALGAGAAAAVFSLVNGVLLRPLPFSQPERLVAIQGRATGGDPEAVSQSSSYADYRDMRAQLRGFEQLAAVRGEDVTLTAPGARPARIGAQLVTASAFPALGMRPVLGRPFLAGDERPGAEPVVMITHALWQRRYGGSPSVLGSRITLDGAPATVVGVLPDEARLTPETEIWLPLVPGPAEESRATHRFTLVGRLRPGVSIERAAREASAVAKRLEEQYPSENAKRGAAVIPLREAIVADARPALLTLFGAVLLVLLIGCANLASLFMARAQSREREMAVRAALGAGRARLTRQWVAESFLLALGGGAAALAVAWAGMRTLVAFVPTAIPRAGEIALDQPVAAFLIGVMAVAAIGFGALPALQYRDASVSLGALREGGRGATAGRRRRRMRQGLVVAEVALATVLAIGAALLVKNLWQLERARLPLRPDGVTFVQLQLPQGRYSDPAKVLDFFDRLRREVAAAPGVRSVSFTFEHPVSEGWTSSFSLVGRPEPPVGMWPESRIRPVSPGYFRTVGLPLVRGTDVSDADRFGTPGSVVVNEAFVREHFPDGDAVGQTINRGQMWWPGQPTHFRIVGVVADEPFRGVGRPADPATYYPQAQFPMNDMWMAVRADGDPAAIARILRERVWRVDRDLPVERVQTLDELLGDAVAEPRFNAALLALFACAALCLAAVGIYGVLSYGVEQRTGEIGVRMALGASRGRVVRQIAAEGAAVATAGAVLGLVAAFALAGVLRSLLVGTEAQDPVVFALVPTLLVAVAITSAWLPARRASRIDPAGALRCER